MIFGVLAGISAALFQSLAFIFSRLTAVRYKGEPLMILCMAHVIMGIFSLMILPFLTFKTPPKILPHFVEIAAMSGFYLAGMGFFFQAIKKIDASRATPILGMKVVFVALMLMIFQGASYSLWQYIAIGLTTTSVFFLNISGTRLPLKSTILVLITAIMYASSDMFIKDVISAYAHMSTINALLFPCIINFIVCGIASTLYLICKSNRTNQLWLGSFYFAITFFLANFFTFYSFYKVGVVYGNIAMSTRGIFSIVIGAIFVYFGVHDLETKVSKKVVIGRIFAGIMMTVSIALFSLK